MNQKLSQIIDCFYSLFKCRGLKSVTMDEVAREMGISKKTLYVCFRDKNDLVVKTVSHRMSEHKQQLEEIHRQNFNAIDESFETLRLVMKDLHDVPPVVFSDLRKYHPDAWKLYDNYRAEKIPELIQQNLIKGISEGLYRADLNTRIISLAYTQLIHSLFGSEYFPDKEFSFGPLYVNIFHYHIHGIASQNGLDYLNEKMKTLSEAI